MKLLGVVSFCLVIAVMLAFYGGDRREKREQRRAQERVRDIERMQNYGQRSARELTEAAERAMTEGPAPAPAPAPTKKAFSKEDFDREQERRDSEMRARVERERIDYERDRSRREYEAERESEQARRSQVIKE